MCVDIYSVTCVFVSSGAGVPSGSGGSGATHAGRGGQGRNTSPYTTQPIEAYGDIFTAGAAGSGGGSYNTGNVGGMGGGLIFIETGTLYVAGTISVDGSSGGVSETFDSDVIDCCVMLQCILETLFR